MKQNERVVEERIEVRSEVNGLVLELVNKPCVINVKYNGDLLIQVGLGEFGYTELRTIFKNKDQPGCNFFDHVLETVKKSVELSH